MNGPSYSQHHQRRTRLTLALVLLAVTLVYLLAATRASLWDRDEPRFSRATVEMVESGNYLYPTFNGHLRPDKPILIYWLMSLPIRVLGPTELACRFFSVLGAAATCLFTFLIARRVVGERAGLWAVAVLASSLMILVIGTLATADAVLLPALVAALAVYVRMAQEPPGPRHTLLLGLAFGWALLAKGPVGLLPGLIILVALILQSRGDRAGAAWGHLGRLGLAVLLGAALFLAWAIPANQATGGDFLRLGLGRHVLERSSRPLESHGGNFFLYLPYYVPVVLAGFFPWTLHLPGAISAALGGRLGGRLGRNLLIAWVAPVFVLMTLVATKLPHYVLLLWPALAIAVAGTLTADRQSRLTDRDRRWLRRGVWFFGPLTLLGAAGLIVGPWFLPGKTLRWTGLASGALLLVMAAWAIRAHLADRPVRSAQVLLAGILVLLAPLLLGAVPALDALKISPRIARAVTAAAPPHTPVAFYKYEEPSLNFYLARPIESLADAAAVAQWARQKETAVLILPRQTWRGVEENYGRLPLRELAAVQGWNWAKGRELEVVALLRGGRPAEGRSP